MKQWAQAPESRDQLVLFPTRLDDAIGPDHTVRLLDTILNRLNWTVWESSYHPNRGQPAIHPRILASVILYGLLTRIRSSRALEEALQVRLDFRWLAEGRSIDHTTLSEFRRKHSDALKELFVQIGLVARDLGWLPLEVLAFDGTRMRANNRRRGTRTPAELREMKAVLTARFRELEAQIAAADTRDEEILGTEAAPQRAKAFADLARRRDQVDAALAELERLEDSAQAVPARLPLTDPQSRVTPNKEGGFAPNYTPLATVDVGSGLIVSTDVISTTEEDKQLLPAIEEVQQQFGLDAPPAEVLADGMMATGENLAECAERKITLYSPISGATNAHNPALREDLTQPVAPQDWERLPTKKVRGKNGTGSQLDKAAFVYDQQQNCYWCPQGKSLPYTKTTRERDRGRLRERHRYQAAEQDCAVCPLRERCLQGPARRRQISHEQHEPLRIQHAQRMATPKAQQKYAQRRHPGERPFAMIKQHFGARRFLLRGLAKVKQEWCWLATAFNLHRLFGLIRSGVDPPALAQCVVLD